MLKLIEFHGGCKYRITFYYLPSYVNRKGCLQYAPDRQFRRQLLETTMTLFSIRRGVLLATAALVVFPALVSAQAWPAKPIKMIVPAGAGAAPDVIARILGEKLATVWGQGVVVENKPGAGGIPGMSALARSAPDGYTIGFVPAAMGTVTPLVFKNPQFNPDVELQSVATVGAGPLLFVVNASSPIKTLEDLARLSKSNPGTANFAAPQLNSLPHLAGEMINKAGSMGMTMVPYASPPQAIMAVLSGDALATIDGLPGLVPHVKSGKLRALAVTSSKRFPGFEDVPTVAETYPGVEALGWFQILVPAGTPQPIIDRLNSDINRVTQAPDVVARLAELGIYPRQDSVASAREFFSSQQKLMKKVVTDLGIKPQ
jgi:tripartite-type tricarboxylate transporter receptor subunit TctC